MSGPLAGVKIVEMVGLGPGPFAAMMLADLGADIVRIHPKNARQLLAFLNGPHDLLARGRPSIAIDAKSEAGKAALLDIIGAADVLIEGFRPGVMERLGLGPDVALAKNPRLVYGRMTGWGQTGRLAKTAGHDINYLSVTGALNAIGTRGGAPAIPLNLIADLGGGGMLLALGIVSALLEARQSGKGQVVDAAMVDGVASLSAMILGMRQAGLWNGGRGENQLDGGAHYYGVYECSDGKWLAVGAIEPHFYKAFLERAELPFEEFAEQENEALWPVYREKIAARIRQKTRDEWAAIYEGTDCCVTPVLDWEEAADYPHYRDRATFVEVEGVTQPAPAPRFSRTPGEIGGPPRPPGEDASTVLAGWGLDAATIARLSESGGI
ncbi:CaiB/BaiF CoA transferase family protein [Pseudochelatococcus contaminans]|uniref:Alpha-methylacyl-CoA racemase n=1 Tax=Pseudochelatococcus contaminans TaxID=1538103 RepID=A0A7W5Z3K1_9HYPH|nr:CaiB/BaiF CoA-transferase family protein [Pseudochelatococcus contaminans]MBB3809398.1 alpha-methylacyl-CoA racemase [Pseudochelatococcus contaminans]